MRIESFSDVAKTVATRMEKTTKAERVVTEILERVLGGGNQSRFLGSRWTRK